MLKSNIEKGITNRGKRQDLQRKVQLNFQILQTAGDNARIINRSFALPDSAIILRKHVGA